MTGSSQVWSPDLGDKLSDHLGNLVVDPLGTTLEFRPQCELGSGELSAIERAVIVGTSYLLIVCVVKYQSAELLLPVNCCLFTLLICARTIVSCTCATCFPVYL
ncbi:hypothetical protein AVEN_159967-1 [Araneus ventricosus]|uniref:Uncharacterized protein n=1 Tax=Araneus ventricosus TaxID=182803 RepID=A0A4Y2I2T7_ARAVE|nr:hypothetical protein AVEN_159967-1 [Araneus ventricosus]